MAISSTSTEGSRPVPLKDACQKAFNQCDFKFQFDGGLVSTFEISKEPDVSFTPIIKAKDRHVRLGIVNANGIEPEFIREDGSRWPISEKGRPSLTPTHFKPYSVSFIRFSGVGHQTFTGNQFGVAQDKCIIVYFSSYQILTGKRPPFVKKNINAVKSDNKCVVFRTT